VLVLSRKLGESVVVSDNQNEVWIKVVRISGGRVQIAFDAPIDVAIRRSEAAEPGHSQTSVRHVLNWPDRGVSDCRLAVVGLAATGWSVVERLHLAAVRIRSRYRS